MFSSGYPQHHTKRYEENKNHTLKEEQPALQRPGEKKIHYEGRQLKEETVSRMSFESTLSNYLDDPDPQAAVHYTWDCLQQHWDENCIDVFISICWSKIQDNSSTTQLVGRSAGSVLSTGENEERLNRYFSIHANAHVKLLMSNYSWELFDKIFDTIVSMSCDKYIDSITILISLLSGMSNVYCPLLHKQPRKMYS